MREVIEKHDKCSQKSPCDAGSVPVTDPRPRLLA